MRCAGIKKLRITCVVEDDKVTLTYALDLRPQSLHAFAFVSTGRLHCTVNACVHVCVRAREEERVVCDEKDMQVSVDALEEKITALEDLVQSVDVAAMNKI
jgi:translation elongation factor EF-1beta